VVSCCTLLITNAIRLHVGYQRARYRRPVRGSEAFIVWCHLEVRAGQSAAEVIDCTPLQQLRTYQLSVRSSALLPDLARLKRVSITPCIACRINMLVDAYYQRAPLHMHGRRANKARLMF